MGLCGCSIIAAKLAVVRDRVMRRIGFTNQAMTAPSFAPGVNVAGMWIQPLTLPTLV
jgi:hypothetical protein